VINELDFDDACRLLAIVVRIRLKCHLKMMAYKKIKLQLFSFVSRSAGTIYAPK
jgi:hypothetical protein